MARQVRCGHEDGASSVSSVIIVCLSPRPCRRCLTPSNPADGQVRAVEAIQHFAQHVSRRVPEHHVLAGPRVDGSRAGDGFRADDDPGWLQATCVSQSSIQASDDRFWTPRRASLPRPKLVRRAMMLLCSDVIFPPPRVAGTPRQQHQRQHHLQQKHFFESSISFLESSISRWFHMGTMRNPEFSQLVQRTSSAFPRLHSTALAVQRFIVPALSSERTHCGQRL